MTSLLLALHLLGPPASPTADLRLFSARLAPRGVLGLLPTVRPTPVALSGEPDAAPSPPPEDRRTTVMLGETAAGAAVLLANDSLLITIDTVLVLTTVVGLSGGATSLGLGSLIALIVISGIDLLAVPFIATGTAYGVSRVFGDTGGRFWLGVLASFAAELLWVGGTFLVVGLEGAAFGSNTSSAASGVELVTLLGLYAIRLAGVPLAASFGLHFGQSTVPLKVTDSVGPAVPEPTPTPPEGPPLAPPPLQRPEQTPDQAPTMTPPPLPPSYPNTMIFPLFGMTFG